jgi:hypothetical protein
MSIFNMQNLKTYHPQLLVLLATTAYQQEFDFASELLVFFIRYLFLFEQFSNKNKSCDPKAPQFSAPQGNGEMGIRYLDPKYSRWISVDPALGEYVPQAPVNDDAKKHNQNLPGMGGLFNTVNLSLYHYAGNNPVKYTDPDGRFLIKTSNAETVALRNKKFLNSMQAYMQPMVLAKDGRIWNINLLMNNNISLSEDLDKAIDNVIKERKSPSPFTKTLIIATCSKLDNDIYKIDIVAATITETPEGTYILSNAPETVAYATANEVGISIFNNKPDKNRVNEIANIVLSYTNKGVRVDEK